MRISKQIATALAIQTCAATGGNNLHQRFPVESGIGSLGFQVSAPSDISASSRRLVQSNSASDTLAFDDQAAPTSLTSPRVCTDQPPATSIGAVKQGTQPRDEGHYLGTSVVGSNTWINATSSDVGYGICYDLVYDASTCKSTETVNQDMAWLSSRGFKLVRTYDIGCDVGPLAAAAAVHGMKVFAGINNVTDFARDLAVLIGYLDGKWDTVDTINIGNEEILYGRKESELIGALDGGRAILREAGFSGNVVTADVVSAWTAELTAASDYVAANAHGYFDASNTADNAGIWLQHQYDSLASVAGKKKVVISESGWPHQGSTNGAAQPGIVQQQAAIAGLKMVFSDKQDSLFLFQSHDATYKAPGKFGVDRSFGIYHV